MEHIRQFDWCSSRFDMEFVTEEDLDNCVTEKILRDKFYDPLLSSDSEDEKNNKINWDEVFTKKKEDGRHHNVFVPALKPIPGYPKLSELNAQQHYQCLKVLCHENPNTLQGFFVPRPTKGDHKVFEQVAEIYKKEQKEYIEWAKTQWVNTHCIRALRPKPIIETLYEAEFKIKAQEIKSFPNIYTMAAHIPLLMRNSNFEMTHQQDLINVNTSELPQIQYPEEITKRLSILRPASSPEPCTKHPCRFILPNERSMTIFPLTEMHRELGQYAAENGAEFIASENALRCLVEVRGRTWTLPVSVYETIGPDGDKSNVIILGNECVIEKETAVVRTYKAFRHLLEYAVIPPQEKAKMLDRIEESRARSPDDSMDMNNFIIDIRCSSDEEDNELLIDTGEMDIEPDMRVENKMRNKVKNDKEESKQINIFETNKESVDTNVTDNIGIFSCTCKDTIFERPAPRSFKKWKVFNGVDKETYNMIVHCSHKVRNLKEEVILEPTLEYQFDLGASEMQEGKIDSISLSLMLHQNASLLNARVEGPTGDVGTLELISSDEWRQRHPDSLSRSIERIVSAMSQLRTLLPAHYLLHYKVSYGDNVMLYAPRRNGSSNDRLTLSLDNALLEYIDEAKGVSQPPTISTTLLPYHKYRKILPCAFTPFQNQVLKETKKPPTKQKPPPQAIKLGVDGVENERPKWPKKKRNKKQRKRQN